MSHNLIVGLFDDELKHFEDVIYHPCEFCGSDAYDVGDCDPIEREDGKFDYKPKTCDICNFGHVKYSKVTLH